MPNEPQIAEETPLPSEEPPAPAQDVAEPLVIESPPDPPLDSTTHYVTLTYNGPSDSITIPGKVVILRGVPISLEADWVSLLMVLQERGHIFSPRI